MCDRSGVVVPAAMAGRVAGYIDDGIRADLIAERERGGPPFPAAPYRALARALSAISADGNADVTSPPGRLLSCAEAGQHLGVGARRVRQLAASGAVPARRLGRQWWIEPEGLDR